MLVLCCPQNGRSSPAPRAPILNLPCPRGLTPQTASALPLLSSDGVPVRWLLMDGYVYDIRDD